MGWTIVRLSDRLDRLEASLPPGSDRYIDMSTLSPAALAELTALDNSHDLSGLSDATFAELVAQIDAP